ncbi:MULTISPECIES: LysR substrate-binding domain-containing protein [unclassified Rhodococcus (in: high G+C Gram-positive bacteria)]|uniref:LysR substrate-binding domain-containing protein n=1 Tax=unclassified Rhodococcus (in: high G+C Gram-positive bacteria) TaxID=192944 RepID=UPI000928921B|nr:LysR substrate-binding domain-containing protein [Rhodococcus sp. M8]OLL17589.1 LysR family transcriptional regulator [Rhodococcus sp. M8]QPG45862.1 LysR family transcriptional regulator [Rhodococcus sp. M8]
MSEESAPVFRLAYVPGVTPAKWVRVWAERIPDVPLELVPVDAADGEAAVRDGTVDAAVLRLPLPREGLSVINLYTEVSVVVVPEEHAVAAVDELSVADLAEETVLHPRDDVLDWARLPGETAFERPATTETAVSYVASEVGVLVVPQSLARLYHRKDLTYRPVTDAPQSQVGLVWLSERTTDLVEEFVGIVRGRTANSSRGRQDESQPKQKRRGERQGSQPKKVVGDKKPKTRRGNAGRPKSAGRARRRR